MKNKLNKILFWITFIPYLLLVINSLINAINGISVGFYGDDTLYYGSEGYSISFVFAFLEFWYILVACLICQIIILLIEKIKKKSKIKPYMLGMLIIYVLGSVLLIF